MRRTSLRNIAGKCRGTQILELALVLPLLLFLVFLVSEGAAFVRVHQVINNAAREGAHFSAMPENSPVNDAGSVAAIQAVVKTYASNNGVDATKLTITVNQSVPVLGSNGFTYYLSQVTVTYPYPLKYLPAVPGFNIPTSVTLKGEALFENLYGS